MKKKRHCDLCDHQILSLKDGNICGVTNKKPSFNKTCIKISLDDKLLNLLKNTITDYELLKDENKQQKTDYILWLILSVVIILSGFFFYKFILKEGYIGKLPFVVIGIGFIKMKTTIDKQNRFKNRLKSIKEQKANIEEVLELYRFYYKANLNDSIKNKSIKEIEIEVFKK